jgi:Cu/Ag efflux protein CusF
MASSLCKVRLPKNGQTATLPLNSKLKNTLEQLKSGSKSEFVFTKLDGKPLKTVQNIFRTACQKQA